MESFLFVIIGAVFLFLYLAQRYAHLRGIKLVVSGYMIILLLSVIVYYLLPGDNFISLGSTTNNGGESNQEFYDAALRGTIGQVDGVDLKENWSFPYTEDELNIASLEHSFMFTVFERKNSDDGSIEVEYYTTNTVYRGIDLTEEAFGPKVTLVKDRLVASHPEPYEYKIADFHNDFVISQFKGGGISNTLDSQQFYHPSEFQVIYIRIPKNLKLTGLEYVNYVGEDM